jgi:hypothetical protein
MAQAKGTPESPVRHKHWLEVHNYTELSLSASSSVAVQMVGQLLAELKGGMPLAPATQGLAFAAGAVCSNREIILVPAVGEPMARYQFLLQYTAARCARFRPLVRMPLRERRASPPHPILALHLR